MCLHYVITIGSLLPYLPQPGGCFCVKASFGLTGFAIRDVVPDTCSKKVRCLPDSPDTVEQGKYGSHVKRDSQGKLPCDSQGKDTHPDCHHRNCLQRRVMLRGLVRMRIQ